MKTYSLITAISFAVSSVYLHAAEVTITLPAETATFKPGKGAELAQAHCLICHSADYISTQPPMTRKFWEATLKKMKDKYAAPTPDDILPQLAEYFASAYGVSEQKP